MELSWQTIAFELVNFLVLVLLLRRFLFRPVRRALAARREEIEAQQRELGAREEGARALAQEAEALRVRVDASVEATREEARRRGAEEAHALVDGARAEARRIHDEALEHARLARERILGEHRDELGAIALEAARRVVGQLGGGLDLLFARRAAERLRDEQGIDEGESITLVTAPSAAVDELRAAVREVLGRAVPIAIQVDARLLGGVRLRARGREFEASAGLALAEGLARGAAHEPAREAS